MTASLPTEPPLETAEARRDWARFRRDLAAAHRGEPEAERAERLAEAVAHVSDALSRDTQGSEAERLARAIDGFGRPPRAPAGWQRPAGLVLHYAAIPVIGLAGLVLVILAAMAVADLVPPHGAGLWVHGDGSWTLSFETQAEGREVLGAWFVPLLIAVIAATGTALWALWRAALAPDGPAARWMRS